MNQKLKSLREKFTNKDLFDQALTHKSWLNEHNKGLDSYERLEFLGDAVLELVVSNELYNTFPDKDEGFLTLARANTVNNTGNLSKISSSLDLGSAMRLSKGEESEGGRTKTSLLADTLEAIIGAIYLDLGYAEAEKFIKEHIAGDLTKTVGDPKKDSKSALQEFVQSQGNHAPIYSVTAEDGPDHARTFHVKVLVAGKVRGTGSGQSKNKAEQAAATAALEKLTIKK